MREYDLCVIGSGPAGQKAAIQAAKLGRSVCVVEMLEAVGGAAINTGTIPSKALREAILRVSGRSSATPTGMDFQAARKQTFEGLLDSCNEVIKAEIRVVNGHFSSNGVDLIYGTGSFEDANTVRAEGSQGTQLIKADHIMIGVGTRPARPDTIEFDCCDVITSDEVLRMPRLPRSLIVVGGGVIGTEYASMMCALGVRVTLIEGRPHILDFLDREISEALQYHLRQAGTTLRLGEKVVKIQKIDKMEGARVSDETMVEVMLESGKTLAADALLYCVGREGATDTLNLEAAGLATDHRGRIKVNEFFQTEVGHIYAAGDVIGFPALAATSMEQGRLAACHMFGKAAAMVPELLPYGIYSVPEISMVGWTEERLTEEGIPYEAGIAQYKEIARGQLIGDELGMLKMLIHPETLTVLGVHTIGTGATELIHIGQAAIAFNATVDYFINAVFNYPTLAECYKVAALNGLNKIRHV